MRNPQKISDYLIIETELKLESGRHPKQIKKRLVNLVFQPKMIVKKYSEEFLTVSLTVSP